MLLCFQVRCLYLSVKRTPLAHMILHITKMLTTTMNNQQSRVVCKGNVDDTSDSGIDEADERFNNCTLRNMNTGTHKT